MTRPDDDSELIRACREGDAAAWESLIVRYRRLIYSVPAAYRLPAEVADDVFQRVAIKLFEHIEKLRSTATLPAWLLVTTRRECRDHARRGRRYVSLDDDVHETPMAESEDIGERLDAVAREHAVTLALERLPEPCRGLLTALYVEDPTPSYEDVARRLGRPVGSLGPTRSRCLEKLKSLYIASGIRGSSPSSYETRGRRGPRGS